MPTTAKSDAISTGWKCRDVQEKSDKTASGSQRYQPYKKDRKQVLTSVTETLHMPST